MEECDNTLRCQGLRVDLHCDVLPSENPNYEYNWRDVGAIHRMLQMLGHKMKACEPAVARARAHDQHAWAFYCRMHNPPSVLVFEERKEGEFKFNGKSYDLEYVSDKPTLTNLFISVQARSGLLLQSQLPQEMRSSAVGRSAVEDFESRVDQLASLVRKTRASSVTSEDDIEDFFQILDEMHLDENWKNEFCQLI
jgi:hypothetical protein